MISVSPPRAARTFAFGFLVCLFRLAVAGAACQPGTTQWVTACDQIQATSSWNDGTQYADCTWNPLPGWAIVNYRAIVLGSRNGSQSISIMAGGLRFATHTTYSAASSAITNVLAQYTDEEGNNRYRGEVTNKLNSAEQYAQNASTNKNTLYLLVWATGSGMVWNQWGGEQETTVQVEETCLGDPNPTALADSLLQTTSLPNVHALAQVQFQNECSHPVELALKWLHPTGNWETEGWWNLSGNMSQPTRLVGRSGRPVMTANQIFYYYVHSTDGSNLTWDDESTNGLPVTLGGKTYDMVRAKLPPWTGNGPITIYIPCQGD